MSILRNTCPVPFDQQPINEYLALKKSWLFSWSTYELKYYSVTILLVFFRLFIYSGFILIFLFINHINIYKIFIIDLLIVYTIMLLIFIRLYLGWSYIVKRLLNSTIFYEESGWYDGQIWVKTAASLTEDRLVGVYRIVPYLIRLRYTCCILCSIFLLTYYLYRFF